MSDEAKAGDRIKFLKTLEAPADEESPACLFAVRGEYGTIKAVVDCWEGYRAYWDNWPSAAFGCKAEEFVVATEESEKIMHQYVCPCCDTKRDGLLTLPAPEFHSVWRCTCCEYEYTESYEVIVEENKLFTSK